MYDYFYNFPFLFSDYQETCIVASESNFLHDPVDYEEEEYPKHEVSNINAYLALNHI